MKIFNKFDKIERITIICLVFAPIVIAVLLPITNFGNGSDDGWLGFWGGFLGAILAVVGVWWQTNKTIKNEKELMFSQKRPYIIIQESSFRNLTEIKDVFSNKNHRACADEPIIVIKNLSNNPMFSIKLVFQYDNKKEDIVIDRIDSNSNIGIVINSKFISETIEKLDIICPTTAKGRRKFEKKIESAKKSGIRNSFSDNIKALEYFNIGDKESEYIDIVKNISNMLFINYDLLEEFKGKYIADEKCEQTFFEIPDGMIITIYLTTTVREKVKLVFKKENEKYRYQKNETKLENKESIITVEEYDTSDMYESYKLK